MSGTGTTAGTVSGSVCVSAGSISSESVSWSPGTGVDVVATGVGAVSP